VRLVWGKGGTDAMMMVMMMLMMLMIAGMVFIDKMTINGQIRARYDTILILLVMDPLNNSWWYSRMVVV